MKVIRFMAGLGQDYEKNFNIPRNFNKPRALAILDNKHAFNSVEREWFGVLRVDHLNTELTWKDKKKLEKYSKKTYKHALHAMSRWVMLSRRLSVAQYNAYNLNWKMFSS